MSKLLPEQSKLNNLRTRINESIRVQRGGGSTVQYVDPSTALVDIVSRHNHIIFARRGSGKTLLLREAANKLPKDVRHVYLNCEDYKRHSFPNVLIEILDATFGEMERRFGGWFGRKRKSKILLKTIRSELAALRSRPDEEQARVKESAAAAAESTIQAGVAFSKVLDISAEESEKYSHEIAREYEIRHSKAEKLDLLLPKLKGQVRELFEESKNLSAIYIFLDDFYFLQPSDQPFIIDYVHRLCKDTPLFFKATTLRNASTLYIEFKGQPTGAQERHDFLPLSVEFGLRDIARTGKFIRQILHEYGALADIPKQQIDNLFMGDGFARLVLAGGGVPRDCLSLLLDALADGKIPVGKDALRELSRASLDRRIHELKTEAHLEEQPLLLRGIYTIRQFCLEEKKVNSFVVEEKEIQEKKRFKALLDRLLDYRLIHELGTAFTHKSQPGTFRGYIVDVGFYASLRKLQGKVTELNLSSDEWKEGIRSSPVLRYSDMLKIWNAAPEDIESVLREEDDDENGLEASAGTDPL